MSTTATARHQIKHSGDDGFQTCLKRARILLVTNGIGSGLLSEVAAFSIRHVGVEDILNHLDDACCQLSSPHTRPPQKTMLEVTGVASSELKKLKQKLAARGAIDCSSRAIVHVAICGLSGKSNHFIDSINQTDIYH